MKKYIYIYKSEIMTNLQYISNLVLGFISCFILLFIFFNLWKYIYSDPNEVIKGYTMTQTVWYVVITEVLWITLGGRKLCKKISEDVKGGNIAYNINKPYSYIGYILSSTLGSCTIKGSIYIILGLLVGLLFLGSFPTLNIIGFIMVLISIILSLIINILFTMFVGLFSFIIEDSGPFYWVYSKFILVLGTLFPVEYFPNVVQPFIKYSPIYAITSGPATLFVNFTWSNCLITLVVQIIYVIIGYLLCLFIYRKGVRRLNVNGG